MMTARKAAEAIAVALEAVKFLHEDQRNLVRSDVKDAYGRIAEKDFTAEDVKKSEQARAQHEKLVKSLTKAQERALRIAEAEEKFAEKEPKVLTAKKAVSAA